MNAVDFHVLVSCPAICTGSLVLILCVCGVLCMVHTWVCVSYSLGVVCIWCICVWYSLWVWCGVCVVCVCGVLCMVYTWDVCVV